MIADALQIEQTFTGKVVLGRYHVVLPLGQGGQGVIHLARAQGAAGVARPVVIKRVLAPLAKDKQTRTRFIREARITARLCHPDIVSIVEFERESDDSYLMVLEYVHGYDLSRWVRFVRATRGQVPAQLLAYIGTRVLDALHYSHSLRDPDGTPAPVIHRDVSAGNVLIDVTGQIKLSDFGIAAVVTPSAGSDSPEHDLSGKLGYIAPELFRGAAPSPASDIYACGVMLHALLGGTNEFQAADVDSAQDRALWHVARRLDSVRDDVSAAAADVIERALHKEPSARFATAALFATELRRAFALDLAETRDELARVVELDFGDARFSELLGVLPLRTIDAAWRREGPSASTQPPPGAERGASLSPTPYGSRAKAPPQRTETVPRSPAPASQPPKTTARPQRERAKRETLGWSAAVALLVALVVVVATQHLRASGSDRVVYVEAQPIAAPAPALSVPGALEPLPAPSSAPDAPQAGGVAPAAAQRAAPAPATLAGAEARLTERFAQRRADVNRCFQGHSGELGLSRLAITFEVDPRGRVEGAQIEPAQAARGELAECLLRVARSTKFSAQPGFMRFRIPISTLTHKAHR
jgi:serine/threonine protein kinase